MNFIADEEDKDDELEDDGHDGYGDVTVIELFSLDAGRDDDERGDKEFEPLIHTVGKALEIEVPRASAGRVAGVRIVRVVTPRTPCSSERIGFETPYICLS